MLWVFFILGIMHVVFAMVLTYNTPAEVLMDNYDAFGTFQRATFSGFQIMTFDSWVSLSKNLVDNSIWAFDCVFFFIGTAGVVQMNITTAIPAPATHSI